MKYYLFVCCMCIGTTASAMLPVPKDPNKVRGKVRHPSSRRAVSTVGIASAPQRQDSSGSVSMAEVGVAPTVYKRRERRERAERQKREHQVLQLKRPSQPVALEKGGEARGCCCLCCFRWCSCMRGRRRVAHDDTGRASDAE